MKIAVLGPGGIGSTLAWRLALAGHDVTVIARGKRLEQLQRDPAIVTDAGERAAVHVSPALDPTIAYDRVLVTVLASQVDAVLPALSASAATSIMFMFNTFEPLARLRDAVGAHRFAFGFPAILAVLTDGVLHTQINTRGLVTTVTDPAWADLLIAAGVPTVVHDDMESWLRAHAAFVVPFMIVSVAAHTRQAGITFAEARTLARATHEGFAVVRRLGNTITPAPVAALSRLPAPVIAGLLWAASRVPAVRRLGAAGPGEPRTLIDAMVAADPEHTATLRSVRP